MRLRSLIVFLVGLACWSTSAFALTADDIMKKAQMASYYAGDDGRSVMAMLVYSKGSKKPLKKIFNMLRHDVEDGGKQKFFIHFTKPSDIRDTTFLVHKYVDQDDFRRLYLPASDKVIPIAGSRKQDPFMGSDFSYEDVSGRHFSKDRHQLLGEEPLSIKEKKKTKKYDTYIVESIPKEKEEQIAKIKAWIDKETFSPVRVEFSNHDGKVYKIYEAHNIKDIGGFPTTMRRVMWSPLQSTRTVILLNSKQTRYNVNLPEKIFAERSLRNPPRKYLK